MGNAGWRRRLFAIAVAIACACVSAAARASASDLPAGDSLVTSNAPGHPGGRIVVALRSEPKTLNPVLAQDAASRDVIRCLTADLIDINRATQKTEPALAKSWTVSPDGRQYTLHLRRALRFSDGEPLDADDVIFSFDLYLDEKIDSPQRDLLVVGGKPIVVRKIDAYTVQFALAEPYAAAERLFDGFAILPRHLLEGAYRTGSFDKALGIGMSPADFAGLGPFKLKEYVPGQRIVLDRNPYYWKQDRNGQRLPYVDQVVFLFVASEDAQAIRFQAGDTDLLTHFSSENYAVLEKQQSSRHYHLDDLGAGLEYNFLFFNLNDLSSKSLPEIARKQAWFEDVRFRQAVSAAIDRDSLVRLVYGGRAAPLWTQVTPGNKLWMDPAIPHATRSLDRSRELLKSAGFSWKPDGTLVDARGGVVEFSVLTSSSNQQRVKIATLIQDDLKPLGMNVQVVTLEFHSMVDRLLTSYDYEAAIMGLVSGDADPTSEMNVWMSNGDTHLWHPNQTKPATPWESEMDHLMEQQQVTLDSSKRKRIYDRVQEIVAEDLPVICLVGPDILVGTSDRVGNLQPAIMDPYTLWNIDQLYIKQSR
jgi:peptide/nickel transport system substrate-binding protein